MEMPTEKIVEAKGGGERITLDEMRNKMAEYRSQLMAFLEASEATVETYKFAVEKEGDGFVVDMAVRASIHPKNKTGITK